MILFWKILGTDPFSYICICLSDFCKGSRIAFFFKKRWWILIIIIYIIFGDVARLPPLFWNCFVPCSGCGHAWETAGGARWQMVWEPVPRWEGARVSEQAAARSSLVAGSLAPHSQKLRSRHTRGAVLSAPQAPAEQQRLLLKLAWICSDSPRVQRSK